MIISRENIKAFCDILHASGKKIAFTNGCFDIIHRGHVKYLADARSFGDCLIVGLNSDASVKRLKGETRPINTQDDRAAVLDEDTAETLISLVRPDVYAKGGDYTLDTLPEAKIVQSYGGRVEFIKFIDGKSTTNIIKKIKESK